MKLAGCAAHKFPYRQGAVVAALVAVAIFVGHFWPFWPFALCCVFAAIVAIPRNMQLLLIILNALSGQQGRGLCLTVSSWLINLPTWAMTMTRAQAAAQSLCHLRQSH